jgi:DNA-directed RNA polymerase subunit RPC12/RpoP
MDTAFGTRCPRCGGSVLYCKAQRAHFENGEVRSCGRYVTWPDFRTLLVANSNELRCQACRHVTKR